MCEKGFSNKLAFFALGSFLENGEGRGLLGYFAYWLLSYPHHTSDNSWFNLHDKNRAWMFKRLNIIARNSEEPLRGFYHEDYHFGLLGIRLPTNFLTHFPS
jgi:hypothetical protein